MSLELFKDKFRKHCEESCISPPSHIIDAIRNSFQTSYSKNFVLVLSEKSLSNDICRILSDCFRNDNTFEEIIINDSMLAADCIQLLIEGICDNSFCEKLSLKGNGIADNGCEQLSKLFDQNCTLIDLCLEWNQVGVAGSGFEKFTASLARNKSLRILDLRNNQIGLDNCKLLVEALKRNSTLKELDLRYNSLGVTGGKELLKIFDKNKTLSKLSILGNNIPCEIIKYIETLADKNSAIQMNGESKRIRSEKSAKSILDRENVRRQQSIDLISRIDEQNSELKMSDKRSFGKIIELEKLLEERRQKCHQLQASLNLSESKLEMVENQCKGMETHFQKSFKERDFLERQFNLQAEKEKDFRMELEKRFLKEQAQLQERIVQLQNNISELDVNIKQQKDSNFELKEKMTLLNSESKMNELESEEKLAKLKEHHQKDISDCNLKKEKDMQKIRLEYDANELVWRDKLAKYDEARLELEEEISRLRNQISSTKISHEDSIHDMKQRLRCDEEHKLAKLEEQLRVSQSLREDLESQNSRQAREIDSLQKDNSKLTIELGNLKIIRDNLNEELSGKHSQMMAEIEKVRLEWMNRVQKLENERQSHADLVTKIEMQDKQIQELRNSSREDLHSRNTEIQSLRDKLKYQEIDINRMKEDEKRRADALQSAVSQYCHPVHGAARELF